MDASPDVEDQLPGGAIVVVPEAGGSVMHLSGDVDAELIGRLDAARLSEDRGIVAVDVRDLGYIDSTGLSLLASWAQTRTSEGADAVVRGANDRFARVLYVSGLTDLFVIEP